MSVRSSRNAQNKDWAFRPALLWRRLQPRNAVQHQFAEKPLTQVLREPAPHEPVPERFEKWMIELQQSAALPGIAHDRRRTRDAALLVLAQGRLDGCGCWRRQSARTMASSRAWQAPCPRFGVVAWAASPSKVTGPRPHQESGGRSMMSF